MSEHRPVRSAAAAAFRLAAGWVLTAYCVVVALQAVAPVAAAWSTKLVVDAVVRGRPALAPVLVLIGTGAALAVLPSLSGLLNNLVGRAAGRAATDRLFAATERQAGLARFEDPAFADRLRLAQQSTGSLGGLTAGALGAAQQLLTLGGFVLSLIVISPVLTGMVLLAGVPVLIAQLRLARRRAALSYAIGPTERRELFYAQLLTTVQAAKEIRLLGIGRFLRQRLLHERVTADRAKRRLDQREVAMESVLGLLGALVAGGGLLWAAMAASDGRLGVGDLTVLAAALAGTQTGLNALITSAASAHHALLMFDHYLAVTGAEPDLPTTTGTVALPPLRHGIELDDVWFRYSPEHPWILRGVSLTIGRGRSVALVGLNGAGKSTLVKLLCRFYDPDRGTIRWDGVDIRAVPVDTLRTRISGVFQDYMAYDLSAAENIGLGDVTALGDPDRIREAAALAGVDDAISRLPHGYATMLSRMFFAAGDARAGVLLSGGQWQRVALARAFLRAAPELVILDEPSSGLDAQAEHDVHTTVRRHHATRATLLISHRLNTVCDADLIVVLDGGTIAERGTHDELMASGGRYAKLFRTQAAGYHLAAAHPSA